MRVVELIGCGALFPSVHDLNERVGSTETLE